MDGLISPRRAAPGRDAGERQQLSRFLTALGDPTRQQIVMILSRERPNVGELTERVRLSRPAVSHHLRVLTDAGLLVRERAGRERVYRLDVARCRQLADRLRSFVMTCCADAKCC